MILKSLSLLFLACNLAVALESFNPRAYTKQSATCDAVHRDGGKGEPTQTSIDIHYVDINPDAGVNRTLLLVHGWPGLWSTWSHQIRHFKDKYRLIAPDIRGFGDSTHPGDVQASGSYDDFVADLVCVLEKTNAQNVVCVGHDWGAQICYEAARMRPDLFQGVAGITLPYLPASGEELISVEALSKALPKLTYNIYFERRTVEAITELNRDIRRTIRSLYRSVASPPPDRFLRSRTNFLKAYEHLDEVPPVDFLTPEEEDYLVEEFHKQKFDHTLQFYTYENRHRNWKISNDQGNWTIPMPALAVYPTADPVADWPLIALIVGSHKHLPYLTVKAVHGAHWVHIENPSEVNRALEDWLKALDVKSLEAQIGEKKKEIARLKEELTAAKKVQKLAKKGEL